MNIQGLDYNTQREQLVLPEYGRVVQNMVDYCVNIPDRNERQVCAETIVTIMRRMFPADQDAEDYDRKLWDHLAMMSHFKLDIDYPYDVEEARQVRQTRPNPIEYPMKRIPIRHYGNLMFEVFDQLKHMEPGPERDELVRITANQMKRDLMQWSHGSCDDEKVASDLARFTDGVIQLDLDSFQFDHIKLDSGNTNNNGKKKRK
ncbi:MAG: DUF4290 domain-containing protein [Prevotellaceae bacterium]|nr:DUF4290 domain-containing protein [Prevotellaceae bacterium]